MLPHMEAKQEQELYTIRTTYRCKVMVTHVVVGAAAAVHVHIYSGDMGWNRSSSRGASHNSSRNLHFDS